MFDFKQTIPNIDRPVLLKHIRFELNLSCELKSFVSYRGNKTRLALLLRRCVQQTEMKIFLVVDSFDFLVV